jgi:transposase
MFNLSQSIRIFVCTRPVDMRLGFNGLFGMVQSLLEQDPLSGHLFLFRNARGNLIKILWWDVDGLAIFAKRLEIGTFKFPEVRFVDGKYEPVEIDRSYLMLLLEGIDSDSVKRLKRYRKARSESKTPLLDPAKRIARTAS